MLAHLPISPRSPIFGAVEKDCGLWERDWCSAQVRQSGCYNVFQELIQNAEDARARQVKFLHDKHSYRAEKLHSKELAQFQVRFILILY